MHSSSMLPNVGVNRRPWMVHVGKFGILFLGLFASLLLWVGAVYFAGAERRQDELGARQNLDNLSRAFEEHITRSIRAVDQTLLYVRDAYARDPANFDMSLWSRNSEFLTGIVFQVVVIGPDGRMILSNIPGSAPGLDLSDREHFKVHLQRASDELFISRPVLGRVSNKWSIQMTRRITLPDGGFGGVVVVSVSTDYLSAFYQTIDIGEQGVVTLVGTDGIVRARGAKDATRVGDSMLGSPLFQAFQRAAAGAYDGEGRLDGVKRLFVYRSVRQYPLIVSVGMSKTEIFRAAERNRDIYFAVAGVLSIAMLLATYFLVRHQSHLTRMRDNAEAGTRARSEFLATMSHEIRTPLNGVLGMSELLMDSPLDDEQRANVRTMHDSARHLLQVINDVLDFSKLEANRVEIERLRFDLPTTVRETARILSAHALEKGLKLSVEIATDVPRFVLGDAPRLRQVLLNLVGNGLKFTHQGGVTVRVSRRPCSVPGKMLIDFAVADTGIGIPREAIPLLFRKFSQLDSSVARRFGGTGLGLAISNRLVDMMGGKIAVDSEIGKGTAFSFALEYLPAEQDAPLEAVADAPTLVPSANAAAVAAPRPLHILIVEDVKTNQVILKQFIAKLGLTADIANNGIEAVKACSSGFYDVIFMDVMMPEMDGLTATKTIRALPAPHNRARIIGLTAHAQDPATCLNAGMDEFMSKPVTRSQIAAALKGFAAAVPAAPPAVSAEAAAPAFSAETRGELEEALGAEDAQAVLDIFMQEAPARVRAMQEGAAEADYARVGREAHALKSSSAALGFARLSQLSRFLEKEAPSIGGEDCGARVAAIAAAFTDVARIEADRAKQRAA